MRCDLRGGRTACLRVCMCADIVFWSILVISVQYFSVCPWHLASTGWKAYAVDEEGRKLSRFCSFIAMQLFFLAFYDYPLHLAGLIYEYSIDRTGSAKVTKMLRRQMSWVTLEGKYLTFTLFQVLVLWLCHLFLPLFQMVWMNADHLFITFPWYWRRCFAFLWSYTRHAQRKARKGELCHCSESTRALELWGWL